MDVNVQCAFLAIRVQNHSYPQAVLQLLRERLKLDINMGDKNEMNRALGHLCAHIG